jgi:hypothetical protein
VLVVGANPRNARDHDALIRDWGDQSQPPPSPQQARSPWRRDSTQCRNAFSKKFDNHCHSLSLYFLYYNFVRIHKTLRVSPAMAAGLTDRLWGMEDIVALIEERDERVKLGRKSRR